MGRGLSERFERALVNGPLSGILERVKRDATLCLELRDEYFNVYYRGGSLMKVSPARGRYRFVFDTKYFGSKNEERREAEQRRQDERRREIEGLRPDDVDAWLDAVPKLKDVMDLFFGAHPKEEREIQQHIVRTNNYGRLARSTDYYVCDIEYANPHGRFDIVAVHWPSTAVDRKRASGRRLALVEVKHGDGALDGAAGLHAHVAAVDAFAGDAERIAALENEMLTVFNQKRALGLVTCDKDLAGFDGKPEMLLVLGNHDPDKSKLRTLLETLPRPKHIDVRVATGSLVGYALYEPMMLSIDDALRLPCFPP